MNTRKSPLKLALKGIAMGMAEVVPGVSGGTIAFITGIYERLINAVKSFDPYLLKQLLRFRIREAFRHVDGGFLAILLVGMLVGLVVGVFGISHLLENYPEELWGFFFGLILASVLYVGRRVTSWSTWRVVLIVASAVATYFITSLTPAEGSGNLLYVFMCGTIAISALILPGISGSFMLLLLGMYTVIIPAVRRLMTAFATTDLLMLLVFGIGCLTGLAVFSRILSWTFKRYRDNTLAILTGFMLGSLNKIWPWRNPTLWADEQGNVVTAPAGITDLRVLVEENVLPSAYSQGEPDVAYVIICAVVGFAFVFIADRMLGEKESI
jgi:putative membrane protein